MKTARSFWVVVVLIMFGSVMCGAQEGQMPAPAAAGLGSPAVAQQQPAVALAPDSSPLTGSKELTLGLTPGEHNFWNSEFQFIEMWDSNPWVEQNLSVGATPVTALQGTLNVDRSRGRSNFMLGYTGGAVFYHKYSNLNDNFHDFGLSETYAWRRWSLFVADQFDFVPSATAGSFGSPTLPLGIGLPSGLQSADVTSTSVAMRATRITNTAVVDLTHTLSPQSSVTFGGSFGVLRFMESGFVNTNQGGFHGGYDRRLSRRDTIALSYAYDIASYPEANARINGHTLELSYARQLTGRFLVQVAAGPHFSQYRDNATSASEVFVDGRVALKARLAKTDISLSLARETNGGSGAMLGAKQNVAALSVARTFPRILAFELGGGVARNTGVQSNLNFNSTYAGGTVTHYFGRHASMFFIYNMQRQSGSRNATTIDKVPVDLNRNVYGIGMSWSFRPRTILER